MLTASPTLLASQRQPSVVPALRVRVSDRDLGVVRQRWSRIADGAEPNGPCAAAVAGDGALIRARIDPGTGMLHVQRINEPLDEHADFATWSALGTVTAVACLGCSAAGERVLIATVASDGETVEVRESADGGASFGSAAMIAVAADPVVAVTCAVQADGSAAVAWASDDEVFAVRRTGTGSWTSPVSWNRSLASISALAMYHAPDYGVVVSGDDAEGRSGAWTSMLGDGVGGPPGEWTPLMPVALADPGTDVTYLATGVAHADTPRLAIVERYAGPGAFDRAHLVHALPGTAFDEGAWVEPRPFVHDSAHGLAIAADAQDAYLCAANAIWHAPIEPGFVDVSDSVIAAHLEEHREGARLRLTLRADLDVWLRPGAEVAFDAGVVTSEGAEYASGRAYWIASVARVQRDGRAAIEVDADGALDALRRWRATRQHTWTDAAPFEVLRDLARLAGVPLVSVGASAVATSTSRSVSVRAGEPAWTAMQRVLGRLPDVLLARGGTLHLREPDAEDDPVAHIGHGVDVHPLRALRLQEDRPGLAHARVIGGAAVAEAVDAGAVVTGATSTVVVDAGLWWHADTLAAAEAILRRAGLDAVRGAITAPPHVALEVGDVIEVTDAELGVSAERVRVTSLRLDYARGHARARAGDGGDAAGTGRAVMFIVDRGELIDFSATGYLATVRLAGSLAAVVTEVPVSRGIDAGELIPGRIVAVALFDAGAAQDAMVVGVH